MAANRKKRIPLDDLAAAEVLFAADRTCCKCRVTGKPVQVHHIDDDPANNDQENLGVLCLECHNETQVRGGFGRSLDSAQVRKYRDDWNERVRRRRDEADRLATEVMALAAPAAQTNRAPVSKLPIHEYVVTLPRLRRRAYEAARHRWDTGVTSEIVEACHGVIAVLEDILAALAVYFPKGHFDAKNPRDYISELLATRFRWHRSHFEPRGHGKSGTIVNVLVAQAVLADAESMVEEMVFSLTSELEGADAFQFEGWKADWRNPDAGFDYGHETQSGPKGPRPKVEWGSYRFEGEEGLFCIRCFETKGLKHPTIRLNSRQRQCAVCQTVVSTR